MPVFLEATSKVIKKLLCSKLLGVDDVFPEILKSLEIDGLFCLMCLFSISWRPGTVPVEWQTRAVPIIFKKNGDWSMCSR